ncbi:MAG: SOS response-associated peptidase [Patescibacteria group bacterium]
MCGRFTFISPDRVIEKRFSAKVAEPLQRHYNAAPAQKLPLITSERPQDIRLGVWGLRPRWLSQDKRADGFINARAETLTEKPSFRMSFRQRRCLIIADSFFEWRRGASGEKQPYLIALKDDAPFAFAGLWELSKTKAGNLIPSFAIITTKANKLVASIHDRMPVILPVEAEKTWLDNEAKLNGLFELLKPYPERQMHLFPVSRLVNAVSVDTPEVIKPIEEDSRLV